MTRVPSKGLGIVAIGRNEGARLRKCIASAKQASDFIVYVDSGSTDGSIDYAKSQGTVVVELDSDVPFTAARARNAGARKMAELWPNVELIHFVDGDCEIVPDWCTAATEFMATHDDVGVICGQRIERYPEKSIYNRLCAMDWFAPAGDTQSCGGDSIVRASAFSDVDGFTETMIAGEEPEMCFRMRQEGWKVHRLDHPMTLHDADMKRFSQWWRRAMRSGHAYAEGQARHGGLIRGYRAREVRSIVFWGLALPVVIVVAVALAGPACLILILLYGFQWWNIRAGRRRLTGTAAHTSLYATFCLLGKFAELLGVFRYWFNRIFGRKSYLIEYKGNLRSHA